MSLLKLWFIRNPVLVSHSICVRQGSSDLSGSQSALTCLCVWARAQLGLREFNSKVFQELIFRRLYFFCCFGLLCGNIVKGNELHLG
jgi:hypothetical protein